MTIYLHHAVLGALVTLTCLSWCYAERASFHGDQGFDDLEPPFLLSRAEGKAGRQLQEDCVDIEDLFFYDTFI
eukprot:CAMPEP_0194052522 /NCGR_PEP_ID=MMETSP0009_2-20130614/45794_1 /TAXON_ID=210454 /ORGANISM="Grammatophora oceanica, Strain CCMP 410" /LENGTH=72 /DNA_ID=CAMNT_0038700139 /DNA_START=66 /DNA_END=281 /DNA_ORIENTATION=+